MKLKIAKKTKAPKDVEPAAAEETEKDAEQRLTEMFGLMAEAELRIEQLTKQVADLKEQSFDQVFDRNCKWYELLCQQVGRDVVKFMEHTPLWEIMHINKAENPLGSTVASIRDIYKEGWRYLTCTYENGARIEVYHRPRMPESEDEFEKMFLSFFRRLRRDQNFQEAVQKKRVPDKTLTLPPPPVVSAEKKKVKLKRK